ncbi:protein trapped in endoderm-1-like [Ptychodera flava]|uniref:protein trapped in endoderm-1-like n=1 Tax=Ptychodera flava TaxID=63121 RepID=UPI00396A4D25
MNISIENTSSGDVGSVRNEDHSCSSSAPSKILVVVLCSVFVIIGLLGNVLVNFAVLMTKNLRTLANSFVLSMTYTDIVFITCVITPILDSYLHCRMRLPYTLCALHFYLNPGLVGISLWHVTFISFNRYLRIVQQNSYKRLTTTKSTMATILVAWVLPIVIFIPSFVSPTPMIGYSTSSLRCTLLPPQGMKQQLLLIVLLIALPSLITIVLYCRIFIFVHRKRLKIQQHGQGSSAIGKHEIQLCKMTAVVFVVILLGYLPYPMFRMIDTSHSAPPDTHLYLTALYLVAGCVNPIIYGVMNTRFREAYAKILFRVISNGKQQSPQSAAEDSSLRTVTTNLNVTQA